MRELANPAGYDPGAVRRARELRASARSVSEIAATMGHSVGWVKRAVRGVPVPPELRRRYAKDAERSRAGELRAEGVTPRAIAEQLGVSVSTVYRWTAETVPLTGRRERQRERLAARAIAEDDELRPRVVALRRAGMSYDLLEKRLHLSGDRIRRILGEEPVPASLRRPRAKDGLRQRARELRTQGQSVPAIALALVVAKSTVWGWTRDLPVPEKHKLSGGSPRQRAAFSDYWASEVARREGIRLAEVRAAFDLVGALSERELLLVGAALYWAEGAKSKPWRKAETVRFANTDPSMVRLFSAWLDLVGVSPGRRRYYLQIHETGDVAASLGFWAGLVGADLAQFGKTTLKRHNPKTNRHYRDNSQYRGCLSISLLGGSQTYRLIEGLWAGIACAAQPRGRKP